MENNELLAKIEALEKEVKRQSHYSDMQEIAQLMARYIFYLENGNIAGVWEDLFSHTDPDVRVEIMDSGAYIGQEHVKRVWYTMSGRVDKAGNPVEGKKSEMSNTFAANSQLLLMLTISTPLIEVAEEGKNAWGQWHLFGPHSNHVFDPVSSMKKHTAFWIAGKYDNEFVKENGEWKIKKLHPICWLRTPYDKSWLENADCRRTPSPYYPPDEQPKVSSFNPDEAMNPDKWGPLPHEHITY